MFICDFYLALTILSEALESETSICFEMINIGQFGDWIYFYPNCNNLESYAVNIKSNRVEYIYADTWKNPDHKVVIQEGN